MDRAKPELYDICPGLLRMKLNLMYTSGQTQVENRTMALDTAIEREHEIVHGVVDLMRTLLDNPLRKHRYIARNTKKLEQNIKNNPKHLNTLADLADLYRSNNLKEKAKIIEDRIGKILQSSDSDDIKEKAICIVEQGYAVLFEESKENELEAQQKLADSFELIKAEQSSSIEERKDLLSLALKYTVNAQRLLCLAINCKSDDTIAEEKKSSIEMFQKGIQYLRNTSYGPDAVSNSEYLNEALDYLNQCISAKGQTYFTAFAIGIVYFDLAEYRLATEWLKRAFMFSDQTRGFENVKYLCISVLKLGDTSCINNELIHVLTFIANRMNGLKFLNYLVPKGLWDDCLGKLWEFIKFLETFHLTADQVKIAEYLKTVLVKKDFLTARRLRICQFQPSNRYGLEYDLNSSSLLRADIGYAGVSQNCRYDYFIIVNEANSGWIQCFLQHELGIQMIDDDITLTGSDTINISVIL
ncbi:unnamed protein product [Mytilus edulis]|uniref:Uncharacterized protein n=1 Tax=Mytilus edulis TaxID=6550 RepID=A0A8S3R518_MYTED|nr:unnamed protein product [Mytilus edulis]